MSELQSNSLSRRQFVGRAAAAGVAVSVAGSVEALYTAQPAAGSTGPAIGYGPLVPDPDGVLDLPEGFRYRILSREGDRSGEGEVAQQLRRHGRLPGPRGGAAAGPQPREPQDRADPGAPRLRTYDPRRRRHHHLELTRTTTSSRSASASPAPRSTARAAPPLGHLAHLRGDRGQGRRAAATPRTTASSSRSTRADRRTADPTRSPRWAASSTRRSPSTRAPASSTRPRTRSRAVRALLPLPARTAARRLRLAARGRHAPGDAGAGRAGPVHRPGAGARVRRHRVGRRPDPLARRSRSASRTSAKRITHARSWRAATGAGRASTSSRVSPGASTARRRPLRPGLALRPAPQHAHPRVIVVGRPDWTTRRVRPRTTSASRPTAG